MTEYFDGAQIGLEVLCGDKRRRQGMHFGEGIANRFEEHVNIYSR